jgi:hypothetical protein
MATHALLLAEFAPLDGETAREARERGWRLFEKEQSGWTVVSAETLRANPDVCLGGAIWGLKLPVSGALIDEVPTPDLSWGDLQELLAAQPVCVRSTDADDLAVIAATQQEAQQILGRSVERAAAAGITPRKTFMERVRQIVRK